MLFGIIAPPAAARRTPRHNSRIVASWLARPAFLHVWAARAHRTDAVVELPLLLLLLLLLLRLIASEPERVRACVHT